MSFGTETVSQRKIDFWDLETSFETEPSPVAAQRLITGISALRDNRELCDESITLALKVCDFHKLSRESQILLWSNVILGASPDQSYQTLPLVCSRFAGLLEKTCDPEWFQNEFDESTQIELALKLTTLLKRFGDNNHIIQITKCLIQCSVCCFLITICIFHYSRG